MELERSSLADRVGASAKLLAPRVRSLRDHVLAADKLHADDTPVPVLQPGRGTTKTGQWWTYVPDDRPAASTVPPAVWMRYTPDRKAIHPVEHLAGFNGILQTDGYAGFERLYETGGITEAACWVHVRRKLLTKLEGKPTQRSMSSEIDVAIKLGWESKHRLPGTYAPSLCHQ